LIRMNRYGGGAIIFGLDRSERSGAVDSLATLKWLQATAGQRRTRLGQVDSGSRSAHGAVRRRRIAVRRYTLTGDEGTWTPPP
jgi:hypothetical protein